MVEWPVTEGICWNAERDGPVATTSRPPPQRAINWTDVLCVQRRPLGLSCSEHGRTLVRKLSGNIPAAGEMSCSNCWGKGTQQTRWKWIKAVGWTSSDICCTQRSQLNISRALWNDIIFLGPYFQITTDYQWHWLKIKYLPWFLPFSLSTPSSVCSLQEVVCHGAGSQKQKKNWLYYY